MKSPKPRDARFKAGAASLELSLPARAPLATPVWAARGSAPQTLPSRGRPLILHHMPPLSSRVLDSQALFLQREQRPGRETLRRPAPQRTGHHGRGAPPQAEVDDWGGGGLQSPESSTARRLI